MKIPFETERVKLTSPYGERVLNGQTNFHSGYDLVGIGSKNVTAVESGTVVRSRIVTDKQNLTWQWGNYVCVKTASGQYHYYCHLDSRAVREGQNVKSGEKLGVMGNTGYSFGAHLHFEVRRADGKTKVNPAEVLQIPNAVGTYERLSLSAAVDVLQARGVLSSPEYWKKNAEKLQYVPDLIRNMAEVIER